jgi:carbamoyltransferase
MCSRSVVLGYSGLHGAEQFRRDQLGQGADIADLRTFQGQDAAAALVIDGTLVAAVQEERFTGRKFDGDLPARSIEWCLDRGGVDIADVSVVAHNFDYRGLARLFGASSLDQAVYKAVYEPAVQVGHLRRRFPDLHQSVEVTPVRHHAAHAFSGVSAAGVDDAAVLVVDGLGEVESTSMFRWANGQMKRLRTLGPNSSLGILYSLVTQHLAFLPASDEYKMMGLAPLGDSRRFSEALRQAVVLTPRGVKVPVLDWSDGEHRYLRTLAWLESATFPRRQPDEELTAAHADLAASVQHRLTEALLHLVDIVVELSGSRRLVMVGGVALNCSAVGEIAVRRDLEFLFVPPAPGDDGTAIGAAAAVGRDRGSTIWPSLPLLGPEPTWAAPPSPDAVLDGRALVKVVVGLLCREAVVGWARGPLEFGPRALGSRSILAAPHSTEIRDRVNLLVKSRETFRPLAPVVLAEMVDDWFEVPAGTNVKHMTVAVPIRASRRDRIAGVVHVDGTARLQSLAREDQPTLWEVLQEYWRVTGVPMLLNTSLNLRGQPIARTGEDAMAVFDGSDLDALVVGNDLWLKPRWRAMLNDGSLATNVHEA